MEWQFLFSLLVGPLGVAGIMEMFKARAKRQSKATQAPPPEKFKTDAGVATWAYYLRDLDQENQIFPELRDALLNLDEKAILSKKYHCTQGYYCFRKEIYYHWQEGAVKKPCSYCEPYVKIIQSIKTLVSAQEKRKGMISEQVRAERLIQVEAESIQFANLADRIREEGRINQEVTDFLFR